MDWFRWWHGTVTDPKFQWVSRRSGQPLTTVIAVWACLLECASNATQCNADATRGDVASFGCNDFDVLLGLADGSVQKVLDAMVEKNLISEGRISGWEKRQPKREDSGNPNTGALSSTERSRLHRERKKHDETQGDEMQRNATLGNDREDKSREDKSREEKQKPPRAPRFDAQAHLVSMGVDSKVAEDWLALRKKKNLAATETAFGGVLMEAQKAGMTMDTALRYCCTRGWGGFDASWIDRGNRPGASRVTSYHDERAETIAALTGRKRDHYEHDERTIDVPAFQLLAG